MHAVAMNAARRQRPAVEPSVVRAARLSVGLTQQELAERLGVHSQTVSDRERGVQAVSKETWLAIVSALGLPMDWRPEGPAPKPSTLRVLSPDDERVEAEAFKTLLPLFSVQAACGAFGGGQDVQPEGWVEAPDLARQGRFVVRARGDSMEPEIPNGAHVVVEARQEGAPLPENNPTALVEYDDAGTMQHAIKIVSVARLPSATPQNPRRLVHLLSTNPIYAPIPVRDAGLRVVGVVVGVLE